MHPYIYVYICIRIYIQFKHNRCVKSRSTKFFIQMFFFLNIISYTFTSSLHFHKTILSFSFKTIYNIQRKEGSCHRGVAGGWIPYQNRGRVVMWELSCGVGVLFGHRFEDISVNRTETLTFHT